MNELLCEVIQSVKAVSVVDVFKRAKEMFGLFQKQ